MLADVKSFSYSENRCLLSCWQSRHRVRRFCGDRRLMPQIRNSSISLLVCCPRIEKAVDGARDPVVAPAATQPLRMRPSGWPAAAASCNLERLLFEPILPRMVVHTRNIRAAHARTQPSLTLLPLSRPLHVRPRTMVEYLPALGSAPIAAARKRIGQVVAFRGKARPLPSRKRPFPVSLPHFAHAESLTILRTTMSGDQHRPDVMPLDLHWCGFHVRSSAIAFY